MKTICTQLMLLLSVVGIPAAQAQQPPKAHAAAPNRSPGEDLYKRNCAVCHGNDLKGNGPAPEPFRQETPDLTTLSKRHDGFPDAYVSNVLKNGVKIAAHGPAEMPIWGPVFRAMSPDENIAKLRVDNLLRYLESIQQK